MAAKDRIKTVGLEQFCETFHRWTAEVGDGYWVTMRATIVPTSQSRPHGLKYALSLHNPLGARIFGMDNAHSVSNQTGPARKSKMSIQFDHMHRHDVSRPYRFVDTYTLMEDFWINVNDVLKKEGVK